MNFTFFKYQGTGNDFVLIDNRQLFFPKNNTKLIAQLCDRKFGIGADGLILLENHQTHDFTMVYYNADGLESSMCGNGGRCIVHFANYLQIIKNTTTFSAIDGVHKATIEQENISLKMNDLNNIKFENGNWFLNTGSPHHVTLCDDLEHLDVQSQGSKLRYEIYGKQGANINFVQQISPSTFAVRTYERGVEAETLSCGTGVTAVALAMHAASKTDATQIYLKTLGGDLKVTFQQEKNNYINIYLTGPAQQVFKGKWQC